jgi:hypothetical protein
MSSKAAKFRRHFGEPAASPRNCLRTRQAPAACPTCGAVGVTVRHTPLRQAGTGCANCCPCCRQPEQLGD